MKEKKSSKRRIKEQSSLFLKDFKPITEKQTTFQQLIFDKDIVIAKGASGVGKTYTALGTALNMLGETYKKLVIVKSVTVVDGENIGYLKGDMKEKMEPFMVSFTGNIDKLLAKKGAAQEMISKGLIEILPLAYIRGITQDDCIVLIDELQNLSYDLFKSMITRIGYNCKYILMGDVEQIDRKKKSESCFQKIIDIFKEEDYVGVVEFDDSDCVRNPLIPKILEKLRENGI